MFSIIEVSQQLDLYIYRRQNTISEPLLYLSSIAKKTRDDGFNIVLLRSLITSGNLMLKSE